ncbi:reverse transcriptase domain-containing protein [Tanacetum coccineum]
MVTPAEKRDPNKYCKFHADTGLSTDECMQLRKQIDEMIKAGKLSQFIKELKQNDKPKVPKKGEMAGKDRPLAIMMIQPWERVAKQRATQSFSLEIAISFPPLGDEDEMEGPMIIEAEIGGHFVHRIYIDGGASSEILYEHCFVRLRPEVRSQMVPATTHLIGFSGETIWPLGQISLLVKIGDEEHSTSAWMNFMVIRSPSQHNGIIGRSGIRKIRTIPSTVDEMLKFPVEGGTVLEEKLKVAIHPEYPEQTIAIGSTLTEKGRRELCALHRQNRDIFAWKPADMTGVPRHIAEHRLNVREGCLPIRQKKRGQAPKRNKAIHEEVGKLVDARIIKEEGMFLGYKVNADELKVCPDKADAVLSLPSLRCLKGVQKLNGKLAKVHKEEQFPMDLGSRSSLQTNEETHRGSPNADRTKGNGGANIVLAAARKAINQPIKQPETTERMLKWKFKLEGYDIQYRPRISIKGQILADFIMERPEEESLDELMAEPEELPEPWTLFTDGSSCIDGSGAGPILTNLEGVEFTYAMRFRFEATNNKAEYEVLIAGLQIAEQIGVKNLQANVDSRLVANQVNGSYVTKESEMKAGMLKDCIYKFAHLRKAQYLSEELKKKFINEKEVLTIVEEEGHTWMTPICEYLTNMHPGPRSVVAKAIRTGYYWPTMHTDARKLIRECNDCQGIDIVGPFPKGPGKVKFLIVAIDYFTKWIEAKPVTTITGNQVKKFAWDNIVCRFGYQGRLYRIMENSFVTTHSKTAIDYFTKWIEAKPVATIMGNQVKKFVWDNIVCRFGLPGEIVSDNEKQSCDNPFKDWCDKLCIRQCFASVKYPQANGLVERANRSLGEGIKA